MKLRHVRVGGVVFAMVGTLGGCVAPELDAHGVDALAQLAQELTATPKGVVLLDAPRYGAPGTVSITVVDSHLNARSGDTEFARVSLASTTSPAGRSVTLRETGPDTGVFDGGARLAFVATGGGLLVQNGLPDLTVAVAAPKTALAGAAVNVTVTHTADATSGAVEAPTVMRLSLADRAGNDIPLADRDVPTLAPGTSNAQTAEVAIPAGLNGTYAIHTHGDIYRAVAELREDNNGAEAIVQVVGADLTVSSLRAPGAAMSGDPVEVTASVMNGATGGAASPSTLRLYLADLSGHPIAHLGDRAVATLAPGASESGVSPLVIPAGLVGDYRIRAIADVDGAVAERDEANNVLDVPITVLGADLAVRLSTLPRGVVSGGRLDVHATVTNDALGGAAPASRLWLDLVDGGGNLVAHLSERRIGALAPGASQLAAVALTIPPGLGGTYAVRAIADVYGGVDERDEENNFADASVAVTGADLIVSHAAAPAEAQPGSAVELSVTVANHPSGGISSPSTLRLYLVDLFGSTVAHLGDRGVPQLAPGDADTSVGAVLIESSLSPGVYAIRAIADVHGGVAEMDETDNVRDVASIILGP